MPKFITVFVILLLAFGQKQGKSSPENRGISTESLKVQTDPPQKKITPKNTCWKGKLGGKIPVFVHYQLEGDLVVGEITYLKTKKKTPIRLIGEVHNGSFYRLLEYDPKGTITGIIEGNVIKGAFTGKWIAPSTQKELALNLQSSDSLIVKRNFKARPDQLFGTYAYAYGEEGYSGQLEISEAENGEADFYLISLTSLNMGPNIAEIERDRVKLEGDHFTYTIPYSESCEVRVDFYKDFARVQYLNGDCPGQFGHNATVEGIFVKVKG
jgi:hypothetical protein